MAIIYNDQQGREIHTEGGTSGSVPFVGSDGKLTEDASNLSYDDTTNILSAIMTVKQATDPSGFCNAQMHSPVSGTDTAFAATTHFLTSLFVPVQKTVTKVGAMIGSVGGTDLAVAVLYEAGGTVVGQSATAGATVGTAANYQEFTLNATVTMAGPAMYYVGIQANGTTAKLRTVPANTAPWLYAGFATVTFGSTAATFPTSFTADNAPYVYVI